MENAQAIAPRSRSSSRRKIPTQILRSSHRRSTASTAGGARRRGADVLREAAEDHAAVSADQVARTRSSKLPPPDDCEPSLILRRYYDDVLPRTLRIINDGHFEFAP